MYPNRNAITLYRVASALLVRSRSTNENAGASRPSIAELCQALQIENAHMALMMEFRRVRPEDPTIQHDIPLIFGRAVSIYDEAVKQNGRTKLQDEGVGTESEMMLCDETYPALFYNAGVYYEVASYVLFCLCAVANFRSTGIGRFGSGFPQLQPLI